MTPRYRVIVADANPSVRENLRYLIASEEDMQCVAAASDGRGCVSLCRELAPDVLVLGDDVIGLSALTVARAIAAEVPATRVILYTLDAELCDQGSLLASACVLKDATYDALLHAIRTSLSLYAPLA